MNTPIVQLQQFIQAIRDAGYRGTWSALAELVDNAFEADARRVEVSLGRDAHYHDAPIITVLDDGHGMTAGVLEVALQFGGSSRFGRRSGTGRFGMGLPNSSVSQARRLEVYTWTKPGPAWWSYLDVDEIRDGSLFEVPKPVRRKIPTEHIQVQSASGTLVVWRKCDRLSLKRESSLTKRLRRELGRVFRMILWDGRKLSVNGEKVQPIDPLFLREGESLRGAKMYGPVMEYDVKGAELGAVGQSKIKVRFAELPVKDWVGKTNKEKRDKGISKGAGVSVLRAGREIDFGWFFMGDKRRENYDDWWRCEIEFQPELDELFGVTHTKQGITPSETLLDLLCPDLEQVAHKLNTRVRATFMKVKEKKVLPSERRAAECDNLFTPPRLLKTLAAGEKSHDSPEGAGRNATGMSYRLAVQQLEVPDFYVGEIRSWGLQLVLNEQHPFCERFYAPLVRSRQCDARHVSKALELLFFAAVRAENTFGKEAERIVLAKFRKQWSNVVAAFLA